jgi:hypothetical protein
MIDTRHQRVEVASDSMRKHPAPNIYSGSTPIESTLLPNNAPRHEQRAMYRLALVMPLMTSSFQARCQRRSKI